MSNLEKVILGMECCISNDDRCDECPYSTGKEQIGEMNGKPEYVYGCNRPTLIADALKLLKAPEARHRLEVHNIGNVDIPEGVTWEQFQAVMSGVVAALEHTDRGESWPYDEVKWDG